MLFNSPEFIFVFLPLALTTFFLIGRFTGFRAALIWLVVLSLIFYAWWRIADVPILVISVVANFMLGRLIERTANDRHAGMLMAAGVAANIVALGWYKYVGLLTRTIADLSGAAWTVHDPVLPLGISFFTFLQIAYLVDVRRERRAEPNLARYSLFVTFFPHLIAGPILHHKEMLPQFTAEKARSPAVEDLAVGLTLFVLGLSKKLLLADTAAARADQVFSFVGTMPLTTAEAWLGTIAYGFQIYFDFSGYSDMAIGLARMFGIRLPVNFDSPYKAASIIEFWRCWHMTLSRFLRDYLYIPLGGTRLGEPRRMLNIMVTMAIGGLWHGASWTFAVWGGLHGVYLVVNHGWNRLRARDDKPPSPRGPQRIAATLLTFLLLTWAWVPFRAPDFVTTRAMWHSMLALDGLSLPKSLAPRGLLADAAGALGLRFDGMFTSFAFGDVPSGLLMLLVLTAVTFAMPNTQEMLRQFDPALGWRPRRGFPMILWRPSLTWAVAVGIAFSLSLMALAHPVKFIYFNF